MFMHNNHQTLELAIFEGGLASYHMIQIENEIISNEKSEKIKLYRIERCWRIALDEFQCRVRRLFVEDNRNLKYWTRSEREREI